MPRRDPLMPLLARADRTTAAQLRALRAAQARVREEIMDAARKAAVATNARERDALYRAIGGHYARLEKGIEDRLKELLRTAAQHGSDTAARDARGQELVRFDDARLDRYWSYVRPGTGRSMAATFTDAMTDSAVRELRGAFVETYRQSAVEGWTANETQKRMQAAWDSAAGDSSAFRFVDRSGRAWDNARYLQMLHRTTAARVSRDSYVDRLTESGLNLARISDDGDPDCPICAAWEGQIVQLAGQSRVFPTWAEAQAAGVGHPNCTHRPVYVDELIDKADIDRQAKAGRVADTSDRDAMQSRKDRIDIAEKRDAGMSKDDARRAVASDRIDRMIRQGPFSAAAREAARQLPPEILDRVMRDGVPTFEALKKGQTPGWRRGSAGGVVRVDRDATAADILRVMTEQKTKATAPTPRGATSAEPPARTGGPKIITVTDDGLPPLPSFETRDQVRKYIESLLPRDDDDYPRHESGKTVSVYKHERNLDPSEFTGQADIGELSFDAAKVVATTFREMQVECRKLGIPPIRGIGMSRRGGVVASMGDGVLSINPENINSAFSDLRKATVAARAGRRPHSLSSSLFGEDSIKATLWHEHGHHVHQMLRVKTVLDYIRPPLEIDIKGAWRASGRGRGSPTSYSETKDGMEWFAESYAARRLNMPKMVDNSDAMRSLLAQIGI